MSSLVVEQNRRNFNLAILLDEDGGKYWIGVFDQNLTHCNLEPAYRFECGTWDTLEEARAALSTVLTNC